MVSPAQVKATAKYIKEHTRRYVVQCSRKKDGDIIDFLEEVENRNGFIKEAIREKIERGRES